MLTFSLLGRVGLEKSGKSLSQFRSQKELAFLIYLAHTGQEHQRDMVADLLWESSSSKQSLTNLRTVIARTKKQVGDVLHVTRKTAVLSPQHLQHVDSAHLSQALKQIRPIETAVDATTLLQTLDAYKGPFLEDFYLDNASRYNEWTAVTRQQIHSQVITAFEKLRQYALASGDSDFGIKAARRWIEVDYLDEAAHTFLIRMLVMAGRPREALVHYEHCVTLLQTELGVDPPAEMSELIQDILPKRSVARHALPSRHNLPNEHNQFFGRQADILEIHSRLDQPWCRLITIAGPGGVGKTRLASHIARNRRSQYPDGTWMVPLANLDPFDDDIAEAVAVEIATVLELRLTGAKDPIDQLIDHLQHKQMLLLLDNFEQLMDGIHTVIELTKRCETVQLLVTSREALQIRSEWAIPLRGLSFPNHDEDDEQSDAVDLFAARQAQQRHGTMSAEDVAAIRQICRRVEGLPLAIELAAALTRTSSCQAVLERLQRSFDSLISPLRDVPYRHHSLHTVFEMSWETLSPQLQRVLAQLSVFRGGVTAVAAKTVADATPEQLAALGDKSLLAYDDEADRYTLHAVVRAYAAKKRPANDPTLGKHAHFYLTLLTQHTEPLQQEAPQESMALLKPEIDNVRRAWQTGLDARMPTLLSDGLTALSIYYQLRGLSHEAETVMQTTIDAANGWEGDGVALATRAGLERARFQNRLGQYRAAIQTVKAALKLAKQRGDRWAEGMGHVWWGESLWRLGEYDEAQTKLNHALAFAQEIDSIELTGWCHHQLGIIDDIQGRYDAAHQHLEKAFAAWKALDNTNKVSVSLNSIGLVHRNQGNLNAAKATMEQALEICTAQDNRYLQAMLLNNLSSIHMQQGDYFGAQYYLQLALDLASASNSQHSKSDIYINLGENYRAQGEDGLAVINLEEGLKMAKKIGNLPSAAEALCRLGDVKRKQGNVSTAEKYYDEALAITQQNNLDSLRFEVLLGLAELFDEVDSEKAKQYSQQAATLAKLLGQPHLLKRVEAVNHYLSLK